MFEEVQPAQPQSAARPPSAQSPAFAEPAPPTGPPPAQGAPSPAPPAPPAAKTSSPWPKRIAAGIIVLAIVAILLGIFLPRETPEGKPNSDAPTPSNAIAQNPQPTSPGSTSAHIPSARGIPQTRTGVGTRVQSPQTSRQPSQRQQALFSPQEAQQLVQSVESAENAGMQQAIGLFIATLRQPEYQDPENWEIAQTALPTMLMGLAPGGLTVGYTEILGVISNSRNGAEAAARLEAIGARSILPVAVQQQIINFLARATDYATAASGARRILSDNGVQLSEQALAKMDAGIADAARRRGARVP